MIKPHVSVRELLGLITPSGRVRVFEVKDQKENLLLEGFRGNLIRSNHSCLNREVSLVKLHPEFYKRDNEVPTKARVATSEKLPLTPENAAEYNYSDICMKLYTDIYIY